MSKFVLVSFVFMGWAFYELSGGDDFVPRKAELIAAAKAAEKAEADARAARVAARTTPAPAQRETPEVPVARVTLASQTTAGQAPATNEQAIAAVTPAVAKPEPAAAATLISLEQSTTLFARPLVQLHQDQSAEAQTTTASTNDIRTVAGTRVNMRNGPGTTYGVLASLPRGTAVEIIGGDGEGWVKLRTVEGRKIGWMAEYLLTDPTG